MSQVASRRPVACGDNFPAGAVQHWRWVDNQPKPMSPQNVLISRWWLPYAGSHHWQIGGPRSKPAASEKKTTHALDEREQQARAVVGEPVVCCHPDQASDIVDALGLVGLRLHYWERDEIVATG